MTNKGQPQMMISDMSVEDLKIIAYSTMFDFLKSVDGKTVIKPLSEIDPEKLKAVKEMKNLTNPDGSYGGFSIEMHDKADAMTCLGKIYGLL